jgi:hypothetical protein
MNGHHVAATRPYRTRLTGQLALTLPDFPFGDSSLIGRQAMVRLRQCWRNSQDGKLFSLPQHGASPMKKIIASLLALTLVAGIAAPAFAAQVDCKYRDTALCGGIAKSLVDTTTEDE